MDIGVNDTAVPRTAVLMTPLYWGSCSMKKRSSQKSRDTAPLNEHSYKESLRNKQIRTADMFKICWVIPQKDTMFGKFHYITVSLYLSKLCIAPL
jgi:hypothetical protein